jgi:hypothetical protein
LSDSRYRLGRILGKSLPFVKSINIMVAIANNYYLTGRNQCSEIGRA